MIQDTLTIMWSNLSSSIKIFPLCLKSQRKATGVLHGALNRGITTWISVQSIKRFSALRGQSMACSNISPLQFCLSALVALVIVSPNYSASYWSAGFPWSILVLCILTTVLEVSSVINDPLRMPNVINKYFSSVITWQPNCRKLRILIWTISVTPNHLTPHSSLNLLLHMKWSLKFYPYRTISHLAFTLVLHNFLNALVT